WRSGSPPVNSTSESFGVLVASWGGPCGETVDKSFTRARTSSTLIFVPPWNAYAVSHHVQRRLHPVSRTKIQGRPARVPSPWIERKISVIVMIALTISVLGFSALASLNQDHCRDNHNRRPHKTKWLQRKSKPMKHEEVSKPHSNGRQNDDEEGT